VTGKASVRVSDTVIQELTKRDDRVRKLYVLMSLCGCRISEALKIAPHHITNNGSFVIKGSKGSGSRMYKVSELSEWLLSCKRNSIYPFDCLNRFYVYRVFKSVGIEHKFEGNKKSSVTHLPRHLLAIEAKSINVGEEIISDALRHKSTKSKIYYEKER
jgi:integrase